MRRPACAVATAQVDPDFVVPLTDGNPTPRKQLWIVAEFAWPECTVCASLSERLPTTAKMLSQAQLPKRER